MSLIFVAVAILAIRAVSQWPRWCTARMAGGAVILLSFAVLPLAAVLVRNLLATGRLSNQSSRTLVPDLLDTMGGMVHMTTHWLPFLPYHHSIPSVSVQHGYRLEATYILLVAVLLTTALVCTMNCARTRNWMLVVSRTLVVRWPTVSVLVLLAVGYFILTAWLLHYGGETSVRQRVLLPLFPVMTLLATLLLERATLWSHQRRKPTAVVVGVLVAGLGIVIYGLSGRSGASALHGTGSHHAQLAHQRDGADPKRRARWFGFAEPSLEET